MNTLSQDITCALEYAKGLLATIQDLHPRLSDNQLSDKIGLSQPTLSRITNGKNKPSIATISKLLAALGKSHQISTVLKKFFPENYNEAEKSMSHNLETPIAGGELADYFSKSSFRNILLLALSRSGTTRAEITFEYGNSGIKKLEILIQNGLIEEDKGVLKAIEEKISFSQDSLRDALVDCVQNNYDLDNFGTGQNWLSFQTESVNKNRALAHIRSKLQKTYKEIKEEILYSSEYYGNDKVFIGMVADTLSKGQPNSEVIQ